MIATVRLLWPFTRGRRRAFAGGLAGTLLVTVAELGRPFPLKVVVDRLLGPGPPTVEGPFVLAVAGLVVAIAAAGAAGTYLVETRMRRAGEHVVHDLRVALYGHLQRLSLRYHRRRHTGDLVTRLTGDVHAVGELVAESTVKVTGAVLLLVGMLAVSLAVDPVLTLAAVAVTPLLAFATVRARRRIKTAARSQRAAEGAIAALGTESLAAIGSVQALGGEAAEEHRLRRRSEERRDAGVAGSTSEGRFGGLVDVLEAVGTALVLGLGVVRVSAGALTPGDLVVMHSYVRRLYRPVRDLTRQAGRIARAVARADRIGEVLAADDTLPEPRDAYRGGRAEGEVELRAATFAYDHERPALRGVSLHVPAGSSIAIVGASGAGKSTLAALLGRFHDPDDGAVLLDGRDLRGCSLRWVRDQVGFVLQDTALFSGTVADNIAYATDARRAQVVAAARAAHAHDFITALPDGYDTDLGPGGASLSGGQRQRLAIARVLLRDPPVVVLDEPTSGLDAASELAVTASLAELLRERTTVLITHSLHLARTADRVAVLDDGRLVEAGDPAALLAGHGPFRRLAAAQHLVPAPPVPAPADSSLPQLTALLDPGAVAAVLDRAHRHTGVSDVTVRYIRYKPGTNVVVDYDVTTATGRRRAVLMAAADRDLAKRARRPVPAHVAADLAYDEELSVLVQWLPLDLWLPALAQPPQHLAARAGIAGAGEGVDGTADLLAYKPRRRAALGVDGHVLKLYADGAQFRAAAAALLAAPHLPVATASPTRVVPDLAMTAQQVVVGTPVADPHATAAAAGALLADLHRADRPRLVPVLDPLAPAVATAGTIAALLPTLRRRLERLTRRLAAAAPAPGDVVCHGDFHARQLLATADGLVVLDLDELGVGSAGIDVASYAAHLLGGADDEIDRFDEVLSAVVDGYGSRPPHLHWYGAVAVLRRAVFPFRTLPSPEWPARVETMVRTAATLASR